LTKTTLRMLSKDVLPKVEPMSPSQIIAVREQTGVSQAVTSPICKGMQAPDRCAGQA
jgi:DNA-binding transcriptional regulator YiaG